MKKNKLTSRDLTMMGLLTALMVIMAQLSVLLPVSIIPITLGTIAVNLIALILAPKQSFMVMLVYMLLGIIGLPVFSGGGAGIGRFFSPHGGYLLAYLFAVPLMSFLKGKKIAFWRYCLVTVCVGIPLINITGSLYMALINNMTIRNAIMAGTIPFIIGDILKCVAASIAAVAVNKALLTFLKN